MSNQTICCEGIAENLLERGGGGVALPYKGRLRGVGGQEIVDHVPWKKTRGKEGECWKRDLNSVLAEAGDWFKGDYYGLHGYWKGGSKRGKCQSRDKQAG